MLQLASLSQSLVQNHVAVHCIFFSRDKSSIVDNSYLPSIVVCVNAFSVDAIVLPVRSFFLYLLQRPFSQMHIFTQTLISSFAIA